MRSKAVICAAAFALPLVPKLVAARPAPAFKVGVAGRTFHPEEPYDWRGAETHDLRVTVWYPADPAARESPQQSGPPGSPYFNAGMAAPDARPASAPDKFPLIALSHGSGGSAMQMAWLGTVLASHGYIAAAVNHPGNNALERYTVQGFVLWWERAKDITAVIDGMLNDPVLGHRIDAHRIGAAGFSLGGYTMIALAGGLTDLHAFEQFCNSPQRDAICNSIPEFPDIFTKATELRASDARFAAALDQSHRSYRDPRIRAVFAIAPPLGQAFRPSDLGPIKIPVAIVAGAADNIVPVSTNAVYFAKHIENAQSKILGGGVGHYTFLDACTEQGRKTLHPYCDDAPGVDRDRIHSDIAGLALKFFQANCR